MSDARSRAKSAQKNGRKGAAQEHRQNAIAHEKVMKELDKRAAKIIFTEKNKHCKEGTIDLHGLYVAEAIQFAKDQVRAAKSRSDEAVRFIVGKGLHAEDGVAKIRPALEAHFTKQGLKHSLDPKNAGILIVRLDCQ
jgi:DNA-nicking Smr family endonuclease